MKLEILEFVNCPMYRIGKVNWKLKCRKCKYFSEYQLDCSFPNERR